MALFDTDLFKPYTPKTTTPKTTTQPGMEGLMKSEEGGTTQPSYADRTKTQDGDQTVSEFLATVPKYSDINAAAEKARKEAEYWTEVFNEKWAGMTVRGEIPPRESIDKIIDHMRTQRTGPEDTPVYTEDQLQEMRNIAYAYYDAIERAKPYDLSQAQPQIIYDENGYPIARGYVVNGTFYLEQNLVGTAEGMSQLKEAVSNMPTWGQYKETTPYQDVAGSTAWGGLQDLMGRVGSEDWVNQMTTGGLGRAEQVMGLQPGTYGERAGGLAQMMSGGIGGMQGLTEQETQAYDRQKMQDIQQLREETKLALEALGASGRGIEAFTKADQISSQIGNVQLQYELKKMELNVARKQAEYDAANKQYEYMVETGQMSVDKYTAVVYQQVGMQLQNYATEIGMIESANRQYLQDYQMELNSFTAHVEAMYQSILMPLQINSYL